MADPNLARRRAFGRAGGLISHGTPAEAKAARQELAALRLEKHIEKIIENFPALTPEQKSRIATLLQPVAETVSGGGGRAA